MNNRIMVQHGKRDGEGARKRYARPVLVRHGGIAVLTRDGINSCHDDGNSACNAGTGSNKTNKDYPANP